MKAIPQNILHRYTLIEMMVAVAILVLMMGFLFQFVTGAQRLWAASTRTEEIFSTASTALEVMQNDFRNAQFSNETNRTLPFYLYHNSSPNILNQDVFCMFYTKFATTGTYANMGVYPVVYYYDASAQTLYRVALDTNSITKKDNASVPISFNPAFLFGASPDQFKTLVTTFKTSYLTSANITTYDFEKLATCVSGFNLYASFPTEANITGGSDEICTSYSPTAIKVTMNTFDPEANALQGTLKDKRIAETTRNITRIFFLQ
ncbi:MAG: hypothetical protein IJJ33_00750 [Victivallales bacterium]|nr:hypothetical protein [Victivallales bacterium]